MLNTDGDAECRLPVTVELVTSEIKVPVRHSVKLREYALTPELVSGRLRLLCGGVFLVGAEHINARQVKSPV